VGPFLKSAHIWCAFQQIVFVGLSAARHSET